MSPFLVILLGGCDGNQYSFSGEPVWELFPFDGQRTWDYISTDESLSYKLIAQSLNEPEQKDGSNVYTVDYSTECVAADADCVDGEILRKIQWSSDIDDGVFIHGFAVGSDPITELSPPLQISKEVAKRDDFVETSTGGAMWTATHMGTEVCPIRMNAAWDECTRIEIAVDAGDGYPIAGSWWATKGNGVAAMEIATETGQWQISDVACEGECDGTW